MNQPLSPPQVVTQLSQYAETYMEKFTSLWEACGYDEISIQQRCEAIIKYCKNLYEEMLEEEETNKNIIISKIEEYLKETAELNKELGVDILVSGYENLPLRDVEQSLRYKVNEYRKIKEARLHALAKLKNEESELCHSLGIRPRDDFTNPVPTEQQLAEFETYLKEKTEERERLLLIFQETKDSIISLMTELEVTPTLEFEKLVALARDSEFILSYDNMAALRHLHLRLERQLEDTKAEAMELREKLSLLWDRLQEDHKYREEYLVNLRGHSSNTLKALKAELKRCEELKRQNIKRFVEEIRKELKQWWNRCLVSEEERLKFLPYSSDCFTEDLLELHELEVQKYRTYYEDNIKIFELVKQRSELWDKMLELEHRSTDQNRLFHNRGGQLLLEEKERKSIQKELPKVEKELLKHIADYEEHHNGPFLFHGERIEDLISNQWAARRENKEQEKKAKKVARDHLLEVESKLGAQLTASKRKIAQVCTPLHSSRKVRRMNGNDRVAASENKPDNKTVQKNKVSRNIFASNSEPSSSRDITTYSDFQNGLLPISDNWGDAASAPACGPSGGIKSRRNL